MTQVERIVFLDRQTLSPETVLRAPAFSHRFDMHDRTRPEEVAGRIAEADIVITNKVRITAADIAAAPRLRFIAVAATGYDVIDVPACVARGIMVSNVRGYAVTTVPEHVFALVLALRRSLCFEVTRRGAHHRFGRQPLAVKHVGDPPLAHHDHAVRHSENLRQLR